jgi:hypothetical protein
MESFGPVAHAQNPEGLQERQRKLRLVSLEEILASVRLDASRWQAHSLWKKARPLVELRVEITNEMAPAAVFCHPLTGSVPNLKLSLGKSRQT